jgi:hypothetical protein
MMLTDLQHLKEILPLIGGLVMWVRSQALVVLRSCPSPEDFVQQGEFQSKVLDDCPSVEDFDTCSGLGLVWEMRRVGVSRQNCEWGIPPPFLCWAKCLFWNG